MLCVVSVVGWVYCVEFDYMVFVGFVNLMPDFFFNGSPLLGCISCLCYVVHAMFIVDCHNDGYL